MNRAVLLAFALSTGLVTAADSTRAPLFSAPGKHYTTVSLANVAKHRMDHLTRKLKSSYAGIPFLLADPAMSYRAERQVADKNKPGPMLMVDVPHPLSVAMLVYGAGRDYANSQGQLVGSVTLRFADGSATVCSIKVGATMRCNWSYDDEPVPLPLGEANIKVINAISEPQKRAGKQATAFLDMLVIELPAAKEKTSLSSITIYPAPKPSAAPGPYLGIGAITVVHSDG
ncbi:MAG: hypothetical protein JWO08_1010 [Verrucomicrobiaceae bacterium]|nr:hypothetical protein [Verrucomicrobiaceae bacterium]